MPSALKSRSVIIPVCPLSAAICELLSTSHSRISLPAPVSSSPPPEARIVPSGLNATARTGAVWPCSTPICPPITVSHRRMVPSSWPVASTPVSVLKLASYTGPLATRSRRGVAAKFVVSNSQMPCVAAAASVAPSGDHASFMISSSSAISRRLAICSMPSRLIAARFAGRS